MNAKLKKLLCVALSALLLVPALAACSTGDEEKLPESTNAQTTAKTEEETDPVEAAISELRGQVNWQGKDFGLLYVNDIGGYKEEVEAQAEFAGENSNAVINDAVFERNTLFEEYCNLNFTLIPVANASYNSTLTSGVQSGTTDFVLCTQTAGDTATAATSGYLYNYLDLDIDYDQEWWDPGTLNFVLDDCVYFMNGPFNIADDDVTYIMMFNKKLQKNHRVADPYQTVRDMEWTMDYMNSIISNLSTDNGDSTWDEKDTYGLTATAALADGFFYGSGLRYINNERGMDMPELMLNDNMARALDVLTVARSIIHENNSTYMGIGMEIFMKDRALYGFEVVSYLRQLSASMESGYGVIPVPKFDKAQDRYYSRSNPIGSTLSIPTSAAQNDMDMYAKVLEMYCLLSQKLVRPAYYEVTLMTRNVQDLESTEMLDLVFSSRVYDMAAYFAELGLADVFYQAAMGDSDNFSSTYSSASRGFNTRIKVIMKKLQNSKK